MDKTFLYGAIGLLLLTCLPAYTQVVAVLSTDENALAAATQDLCHNPVVMLGESATHGEGHTLAFKVALVGRLVDRCSFNTVFFEANQDEFINLNRRIRARQAVTAEDLLSAVGGLWKFYREFQPLAPFLLERAQSGQVFLGGLDDQLGQLGQNYANLEMTTELTDLLPDAKRESCSTALHKRIYLDYSEAAPYSKLDRSQIDNCLAGIQAASIADPSSSPVAKEERQEMISATRRWMSRDFSSDTDSIANRDRSMFQTFQWLQSHRPKKSKVIVWAATVHIAKQGDPTWGDHAGTNLGSLIHREYGNHAQVVAFSALTGSFRQGKRSFPAIPTAPEDSVEARVMPKASASTVYVSQSRLASLGKRAGAFFTHSFQTLAWTNFLDSVVVFPAEYPPTDTRSK